MGIRSSRRSSVSALSVTIVPPSVGGSPFRGLERRSPDRQLLRDDLHPLTTIVDIDQWSAETAGDALANGINLRQVLRNKLAGDVEAGLDQPEREGEVDHRASGRTLGDPDADQARFGAADC